MIKVNEEILVNCIDVDYNGNGVARFDNFVIFVRGLLFNEKAKIRITRVKNNFAFADIVELIEKSATREEKYKELEKFGSTDLIHLKVAEQIKWQEKTIIETINKVANIKVDIKETFSGNDKNYRNKVVFHRLKNDFFEFGLYDTNNNLTKVDSFVLANERMNDVLTPINNLNYKGVLKGIKHLVLRTNGNEVLVTFVSVDERVQKENAFVELIKKLMAMPIVVGITLNIEKSNKQILGAKSITIYGKNEIEMDILDRKFVINDRSFFQINTNTFEKALNVIKNNITKSDIVLDAYSGVGSIGLSIGEKVKEVRLVEINKDNIKMAKKSIILNDTKNVKMLSGKVEDFFDSYEKTNVVIVDPPRTGLSEKFANFVNEKKLKKIIYLSCDVKTLARDIRILSNYKVKEVYSIRMFPHTTSIETLIVFDKLK